MVTQLKAKQNNVTQSQVLQYDSYLSNVKSQISECRTIFETIQNKNRERSWLRHKSTGDLDETKLTNAVLGESTIWKQRGIDPFAAEQNLNAMKKIRVQLMIDLSASMYRFNDVDGRLDREIESVLMFIESFASFEQKFSYGISGHSGDGPDTVLIEFGKPPRTVGEKLKVVSSMRRLAEYSSSGDYTLESIGKGIEAVKREEGTRYFVFVLSDANLGRYGIEVSEIRNAMNGGVNGSEAKDVEVHVLFIASRGGEAEQLKEGLPPGRGHVCLEVEQLPSLLKMILSSNVMAAL
eukprot:TRINITY_DN4486_c0_g1_i1.p1 TRINITY_DN4486_c0_g1~~TRINITY_DN4486_c0_g1_i1.p1  ORF type:complete len:294 (-),score=63.46 TRINITY_DN4486_c0_g1_i1:29-910(-)